MPEPQGVRLFPLAPWSQAPLLPPGRDVGRAAPGCHLHGKSAVSVIRFLTLPLGPHLFNSVTLFKNLSKYFRPEVVNRGPEAEFREERF